MNDDEETPTFAIGVSGSAGVSIGGDESDDESDPSTDEPSESDSEGSDDE